MISEEHAEAMLSRISQINETLAVKKTKCRLTCLFSSTNAIV
jgi:hypothetical protein